MMAEDGIFVVIAIIDKQTGKVSSSPDIISRGFIYMRESKDLLAEVRKKIREIVEETTTAGHPVNWSYVKDTLRDKIGQLLYNKTQRRPMVIPVVIEV
jgi:ribonuclease J